MDHDLIVERPRKLRPGRPAGSGAGRRVVEHHTPRPRIPDEAALAQPGVERIETIDLGFRIEYRGYDRAGRLVSKTYGPSVAYAPQRMRNNQHATRLA